MTLPQIPQIPADVSYFNNDAGYITMDSIPQTPQIPADVSYFNNDVGYITMDSLPQIPQIPADVSAFNNDVGYITSYTETQTLADVTLQGNSAGNRQLKDVADPTESYDAVNLRSLTQMMDSASAAIQLMQQQLLQSQQQWQQAQEQWQETQEQWQIQQQQMQQQWQQQQLLLQQQIDSLTLILNAMAADTAFTQWNTSVVNETACNAYEWHGETYTQSGVYLYGFTNTDGSNNVEALNLTIVHSDTSHLQEEACDSYTWHGTAYSETGDYSHTLTNRLGCDSVLVLHLTVHHGTHSVFSEEACESYLWHDSTYTESGVFTYAYNNDDGCASVDTLKLTIFYGTHNVETETACDTFTWHGTTYTENGTCTFAYTDEHGCASVDTLHVTILHGTHNVFNEQACGSYTWHDNTYNQSGDYTYSYTNEDGCPSVDTLKVKVAIVDEKSCPSESCVTDIDGNIYSTVMIGDQCWMRSNLRTTRFPDGTGIPKGGSTLSGTEPYYYDNACFSFEERGYSYNWPALMHGYDGNEADPSGVQGICPDGWHVPNHAEWVQLTNYVSSQSQYVCGDNSANIAKALASQLGWSNNGGDECRPSWNLNENNATGFNAFPAGNYIDCHNSAPFWSSTVWLYPGSIPSYRCDFWLISAYDADVKANTIYVDKHFSFPVRCLRDTGTVINPIDTTECIGTHNVETESTCVSYTWHGNTYAESGVYTYDYTNSDNCPSVDTLFLTIYEPDTSEFSATACGTYTWGAVEYMQSGDYTQTILSNDGCDTVVTLHLTVYNGTHNVFTETANGSFIWHDSTYSQSGTYTYEYANENGCTSVDTLYLTVSSVTPIIPTDTVEDGQPCPGTPTVTDVDGNTYNTVLIGDQCWMRENLRTTRYSDGLSLALGGSTTSTVNGYYYHPNGDSSKVHAYGYLYNWKAVMRDFSPSSSNPSGVQGICPMGWHVPSDSEWTQLTDYVESQTQYRCSSISIYIAKALADSTGWDGSSTSVCAVTKNPSNNNGTGFSAMPAGYYDGGFSYFGKRAYYWHSSDNTAYIHYLRFDGPGVGNSNPSLGMGYSVRCLRDQAANGNVGGGSQLAPPTVTTSSVSNITTVSATSGGNVISDGNASVMARGVCWSTLPSPTFSDAHTTDGSGTGLFTSNITELEEATTYFLRAYATNSTGISYGAEVRFTTPISNIANDGQPCSGNATVTDIDGNVYNTVRIGNQCWMKENLRTTRCSDGTALDFYYPNNDSSKVNTYGCLYNWYAVMHGAASSSAIPSGVQGICPVGWHVPSAGEWSQLEYYVSSQNQYLCDTNTSSIAKALANTTGWANSNINCQVGKKAAENNSTGFSALPAGYYYSSEYKNLNAQALFWTSTERSATSAYERQISYTSTGMGSSYYNKNYGYSVRCLRDTETIVNPIDPDTTECIGTHNVETESACETFTWHDSIYTQSGTYTYAYTNEDGCASVDTLHLTVSNTDYTDFTDEACGSYLWNGETYSASGDYTRTFTNASGCDSVVTLHLTISSNTPDVPLIIVEDSLSCPGAPRVSDHEGNIYNTVKIGNQCWTKENMRCTTSPTTGSSLLSEYSTAASKSAGWHSGNPSHDPAYGLLYNWCAALDTFYAAGGAPEVANGSSSQKLNYSFNGYRRGICPIGWHVPATEEWREMATYIYQNGFRCSDCSYPELDEYVASCIAKALSSTTGWDADDYECAVGNDLSANNATGFNALPAGRYSGSSYSSFGDYAYFWTATEDYEQYSTWAYYFNWSYYESDIHLNNETPKASKFSVRCVKDTTSIPGGDPIGPPSPCLGSHISESAEACDSYTWHGQTCGSSGIYVYDYINAQGCPSADTLHLTIHEPTVSTSSAAACDSYTWHGQTYTESGIHTHHYTDLHGCTGTEILNLTIYNGTHTSFSAEDCQFYTWHGTSYNASGSYTYGYTDEHGCACTDTLHLTIKEHPNLTSYAEACGEYTWRGSTYTASGSYTADYLNDHGCLCTETLHLTIHDGTHNSYTKSAYNSYSWHGTSYNASGSYTYAYFDEYGCPSVDTLHLTIGDNSCPGTPTVSDHEGNVYNTVQIGTQCWTRENMRCTTSPTTGTNFMGLYLNNDTSTAATYGLLYNWDAAMSICPQGWHLPSVAEWTQMLNYVQSQSEYWCGNNNTYIAKALASETGWVTGAAAESVLEEIASTILTGVLIEAYDSLGYFDLEGGCAVSNNPSSNNATGFSALPAGYYFGPKDWDPDGFMPNCWANFFSSTQTSETRAYGVGIFFFSSIVATASTPKHYGNSVRCVKD